MKAKTSTLISIIFVSISFSSCFFGAGTLGGFDSRIFPTPKQKLVEAIDSLYSEFPEYKIPDKWESFNDWKERGYDFLDSRIFYFKSAPEEMYYVTFIGEGIAEISVRAVHNGTTSWKIEQNTSSHEKKRIEQRFDIEIISKLEKYTNTKSITKK